MMRLKSLFLLCAMMLPGFLIHGQISQPATPPGFGMEIPVRQFVPMPAINVDMLVEEDYILDERMDIPWRFGYNIPVHLNPDNSGQWTDLPGEGRVWQLGITSPGAYSLNLAFNEFLLPPGAMLFVYSPRGEHVLGAFTHQNNQADGYFATTLLSGDSLVVEYFEPYQAAFSGRLNLATVTHAYRDPSGFTKLFGRSGWCNINVACEEAQGWEDQIRSVVMLVTGGNSFCSGVMINNTNQDGRPFLLSANHCYRNPSTLVAWFNFQSENCENPDIAPSHDALSGAISHARSSYTDFWLLEMNHPIPDAYDAYLAGWNRNLDEQMDGPIIGIHHPRGDIKKFSYSDSGVQAASYLSDPGVGVSHWHITWDGGTTTEPGSSGSPIFDAEGRIIGQLHGGYAACGNTRPDWYGRFGLSWIGGGLEDNSLKPWLDPLGLQPNVLEGFDPLGNLPEDPLVFDAIGFGDHAIALSWAFDKEDSPGDERPQVIVAMNDVPLFGKPAGHMSLDEVLPGGGRVIYLGGDNDFLVDDLNPGQRMFFKVWTVSEGFRYSHGITAHASAFCPDFASLPFASAFNDGLPPSCWHFDANHGEGLWTVVSENARLPQGPFFGQYSLALESTDAVLSRFVSPLFYANGADRIALSFARFLELEDPGDMLTVLYRPVPSEDWQVVEVFDQSTGQWTVADLDIPLSSDHVQVAFEGKVDGGGIFLDAIAVNPSYDAKFLPPSDFVAEADENQNANLSWSLPEVDLPHAVSSVEIFRNDQPLVLIDDLQTTSYVDAGLPIGSYHYMLRSHFSPHGVYSPFGKSIAVDLEVDAVTNTLTIDTLGPGQIYPVPGQYLYNAAATARLYAIPGAEGYFDHWQINGAFFSSDNPLNISMDEDLDVHAVFLRNQHQITLSSTPSGIGVQTGGGLLGEGSRVRLATSLPHYWGFKYWEMDGVRISNAPAFWFEVKEDAHLVAVLQTPVFRINAFSNPPEGGRVEGSGDYEIGQDVLLKAFPSASYGFSHWSENGTVLFEQSEYPFVADAPRDLVANFEVIRHPLNIYVEPGNGGFTIPDKGTHFYSAGEKVTLRAIAAREWIFDYWAVDGVQTDANPLELVFENKPMEVTAHFQIATGVTDPHLEDSFLVYPNPASDLLHIVWPNGQGQPTSLVLINFNGQEVFRRSAGTHLMHGGGLSIPLKGLPSGIYLLQIFTLDGVSNHRILLQ